MFNTNDQLKQGNNSYELLKDLIIECKVDYQFFDKKEKVLYSSSKISFDCDNKCDSADEHEKLEISYQVFSDMFGFSEKDSSSRSSFTSISHLSDCFNESQISSFDSLCNSLDANKKLKGEKNIFIFNKS
jgi:hypothetical protein